ncbi:hypothetical protein SVIOM342S_03333 [Streptomyces violaceorubidus]
MTGTPDETPTNTFAPGGRRRHRKARVSRVGARRALVLAMAVPVASATLAGTSAFAADDSTPQSQGISVDDLAADDAQLVKNLNERLADERLGTDVSGVVLDADSDTALWDHNGSTALMPASNAKLATATTALTLLGANHEFTTKVVYGEGTVTLVGGGDRTLTSEDVAELARTAADGFKAAGRSDVQVRVDDSLFADPSLAEGWNEGYYPTEVAPVRSLVVDGAAVQDTSIDAGKVFAKKLAEQGVTVTGEVGRTTAKQSDVPVAQHKLRTRCCRGCFRPRATPERCSAAASPPSKTTRSNVTWRPAWSARLSSTARTRPSLASSSGRRCCGTTWAAKGCS